MVDSEETSPVKWKLVGSIVRQGKARIVSLVLDSTDSYLCFHVSCSVGKCPFPVMKSVQVVSKNIASVKSVEIFPFFVWYRVTIGGWKSSKLTLMKK